MKKKKNLAAFRKLTVLALLPVLAAAWLCACGSEEGEAETAAKAAAEDISNRSDPGDSWEEAGNTLTLATEDGEVAGLWSIGERRLYIDPDAGMYTYQTPDGRVGTGKYSTDSGTPMICFNGYDYNLAIRQDGILVPIIDGEADEDKENIDRITFEPDSGSIETWSLSDLAGYYVNDSGEAITIDADNMQYTAESDTTSAAGTIGDDCNGMGPFLSLNGYGYICSNEDLAEFTLQFVAGTYSEPDGSFEGTFYVNSGNGEDSDPGDTLDFGSGMDYITPDYTPHEINTKDDNGQRYHIEDHTAHVQTYCLMNMEPMDMYKDALVLTSHEDQYTFIRYITDEYYAFDGTDDEFAQYLIAKFCASDIINIYGGEAPVFELNYDAPGGDRIVSGSGYVYNDCMSGSVNICAYGGDGVYMLRMHVATGEYADDLLGEQIAVVRSSTYLK